MQKGSLASLAVDGSASSYAQASNQWRWQLVTDIGLDRPINYFIVTMPSDKFATSYQIDFSVNGTTWQTGPSITDGVGGTRAISVSLTARYLRVVAIKPDGAWQTGGQMAISRFSVYGGADLAMGATASATYIDGSVAAMQPNGDAVNAVDGNTATWAQATGQYRWQLTLDLGAAYSVGEVDVLMPAAAFGTAFHVDTRFDPASGWALASTVTDVGVGGFVPVVLPFARTCRYVRIVADLPDGSNQRGGQMGIAQVIVTR
jgi:hypothetical protein